MIIESSGYGLELSSKSYEHPTLAGFAPAIWLRRMVRFLVAKQKGAGGETVG